MPNAKDLILRLRSITDGFRTDQPVAELSDLRASLKGTGDQASRSAREVRQAADQLDAPGFDRAAAEAESTARRMRAAATDMGDGIRRGATQIETETDNIRRNMDETGREAGAEFISNVAEGIGSGQANLTDVMTGTLGGLTNLAATMTGPVALAAAGAAAGIGLVFSAIKGEAEKAKERIDGLRGALSDIEDKAGKAAEKAIFEQWVSSAQETTGKIENTRDVLEQAGIKASDFRKALAGDPTALARVTGQLQRQSREISGSVDNMNDLNDEQNRYIDNLPGVLKDLGQWDASIGAVRREQDAINDLLGKGKGKTKEIGDELDTAAGKARNLKRDIDAATRDRTMNLTIRARSTGASIPMADPRTRARLDTGR